MACELPQIVNDGQRSWSMSTSRKGYRTYKITYRVQVDRGVQGPCSASQCPGLPEPGSIWQEPDIIDPWAYFTQEVEIVQVGGTATGDMFDLTFTATTEPVDECPQVVKDDPLTIPDRIHTESVDAKEEMVYDADDLIVANSAWEQYRGPQVERDTNKIRVIVEQNAANLELDLIDSLMHHTNDAALWGFNEGCVKLAKFEEDPKYTVACSKYYLRRFTFDIDRNGWLRNLLDEGTKVLHGRWDQAKGTGCTLTLTTTGGIITSATISAPGTGYPASSIVPLKVTTGGTKGIVLVETNSTGAVIGYIRVHMGGTGYSNGASNTSQRGYWVLLRINGTGEVPIDTNPQHFDRPGDIKGQNTRFILDGKGMPIADDEDGGNNIFTPYASGNLLLLGIPLSLETPL